MLSRTSLKELLVLAASTSVIACGSGGAGNGSMDAGGIDPIDWSVAANSCAFTCPPDPSCTEGKTPYACQNLGEWSKIPHTSACSAWDGNYPTPTKGQCSATAPTGEAAKYAGPDPDDASVRILADGHRVRPYGTQWVFQEADMQGGLTSAAIAVPGTKLVLTVDTGLDDHAVRLIDTTKFGAGNPVASYVKFSSPEVLNSSAVFIAPDLVYVATDGGKLQALRLDTTAGLLTRDDARSIALPGSTANPSNSWYVAALALAPDGKHLLASPVGDSNVLVIDVEAASPTVGKVVGTVNVGKETFAISYDPFDASGKLAYVTLWSGQKVVELNLATPSSPTLARSWVTEKQPEGIVFLDARWMLIANDLADSFTMVDRVSNTTTNTPLYAKSLHGFEPGVMAFDAANKRLYATLAGIDAIAAWDVDTTASPPKLTLAGRLSTGWWPSGLALMADGSLVASTLRGVGSGISKKREKIGDSLIGDAMRGSIALLPKPSAADLSAQEAIVARSVAVGAQAGSPVVKCPSGVDDFPLPSTNTAGPSKQIEHVFFIVRENKNFDGVLGDFPGVNGDPSLTLKTTSKEMEQLWGNFRTLARTWSLSDNYYTGAIFSTQGHTWTMYGRTDDFNERTWAVSGAGRRARNVPGIGFPQWAPAEGSLFDWLDQNSVAWNEWGELVGMPSRSTDNYLDLSYPGGSLQNLRYPDTERACYLAGRLRVRCDLGKFEYICLPNDHTFGIDPKTPTPESCIATNDEATGLLVDAITHSPDWQRSLIVILEDDAAQGGEHVDLSRSLFVLVSPWIKRGYVSHTHIDGSSVHKLFAHVLGIPYPNALVANAALPTDMFTSTPDYTPYTYAPRTWPLECGAASAKRYRPRGFDVQEPRVAFEGGGDIHDVDDAPELDRAVTEWLRERSRAEQVCVP